MRKMLKWSIKWGIKGSILIAAVVGVSLYYQKKPEDLDYCRRRGCPNFS